MNGSDNITHVNGLSLAVLPHVLNSPKAEKKKRESKAEDSHCLFFLSLVFHLVWYWLDLHLIALNFHLLQLRDWN
ncbi:hypothetical protein Pyn_17114 [Prunus yedoensis var. nudiflora]|uniref:Uncharacterized protein n=1 Tax=Prunus yedoensis var. nudiflora TaxID=2094558 RepID=A0A314V253_PRUYE|nr:hypothetical protein Pyn_17114 [Prunus yedoensis var. nudiflora]